MNKYDLKVWRSRERRAKKCKEKDAITRRIIASMRVGRSFKCVLMPCLHGIELELLEEKGVTADRIYAIEHLKNNWRDMRKSGRVTVTPRPLDAHLAVDHIEALSPGGFHFVYGDFFGQPDLSHAEFLYKIFALGMIQKGGKLLMTFGLNRCHSLVKEFNTMLMKLGEAKVVPTRHYIDVALELSGHRHYRRLREHPYTSKTGSVVHQYTATEVDF
jgi:hypothetical protein